jgi:hypothetical protein
LTDVVLGKCGEPHISISNGFIAQGGTPNHCWLNVRLPGTPFNINVLAATEAALEDGMKRVAEGFSISRELLVADRPEGRPFDRTFPF